MTETLAPPRRLLLTPLRSPSFRHLWCAQFLSLFGDGCGYVAFAWITLTVSRSSLALGLVLAAQAVPRALLTLVGGALSDRMSPRSLMMGSSCLRAALTVVVAGAGLGHLLSLWLLLAAAALFGAVDAFFQPARGSILPSAVPPEQLEPANALLNAGSRVAMVLGPALGGVVVAVAGANVAFLVDGGCFALVAVFTGGVRTTRSPGTPGASEPSGAESLRSRIRDGLGYVWADPRIRAVLVVDAAVTFCYAGPFTVGFASLARFRLGGGATDLGLLNGALAAGAIAGSLLGGASPRRLRVGPLIAALTAWLAVGMFTLGITTGLVASMGAVALMGAGIGFQGVFGLSWIQRGIAPDVLGRVIAVDMVAGYVVAPVSLVLCGVFAQPRPALVFLGTAVLLVLTTLGVLCSRSVRAMT
ncbi:MAG: MFS transporter [Actinoallomurus sp.]